MIGSGLRRDLRHRPRHVGRGHRIAANIHTGLRRAGGTAPSTADLRAATLAEISVIRNLLAAVRAIHGKPFSRQIGFQPTLKPEGGQFARRRELSSPRSTEQPALMQGGLQQIYDPAASCEVSGSSKGVTSEITTSIGP